MDEIEKRDQIINNLMDFIKETTEWMSFISEDQESESKAFKILYAKIQDIAVPYA